MKWPFECFILLSSRSCYICLNWFNCVVKTNCCRWLCKTTDLLFHRVTEGLQGDKLQWTEFTHFFNTVTDVCWVYFHYICSLKCVSLFRSIRCLRNIIHWNLITTFILRNVMWFLLQMIDHNIHESNEVSAGRCQGPALGFGGWVSL